MTDRSECSRVLGVELCPQIDGEVLTPSTRDRDCFGSEVVADVDK